MENEKQLVKKEYSLLEDEDTYIKEIKNGNINIHNIPKKALTYLICLEGVKRHGAFLRYVPEELMTPEICIEAIKSFEYSAKYIPEKMRSKAFYTTLFKECPKVFSQIPKKYLSDEIIQKALSYDGANLRYIDEKNRTKEICLMALERNPMALEFVPVRLKKEQLYVDMFERDYRVFTLLPDSLRTLDRCISALNRAFEYIQTGETKNVMAKEIAAVIPKKYQKKNEIIELERKTGARRFVTKLYDDEKKIFYIKEVLYFLEDTEKNYIEKTFKNFDDFYNYLNQNLQGTDLYNYNFEGINLNEYNIDGAYIKSDILVRYGLYDDEYYNETIEKHVEESADFDNEEIEMSLVKPENIIHDLVEVNSLNERNNKIYYISDIHLCHKLKKKFPVRATKREIFKYLVELIDKMLKTSNGSSWRECLFIGGDVSSSYEITKMFYRILRNKWHGSIIAILGNHEIWNMENEMNCNGLDEIVEKYRQFFNELRITLIQNEIVFDVGNKYIERFKAINEEELLKMQVEELRNLSIESRMIILGGIGFSGLNPIHNANLGLYRNTVSTLKEDKIETEKFTKIYNKVREIFEKDKVIVFTHTPKDNWSTEDYNKNWIYVSGHTHRNEFFCTTEKTVYSDNQIGYENTSIGLKFFEVENKADVLRYYEDGIYKITRAQYLKFYRGLNVGSIDFNVVEGIIYMLKRDSLYMFLYLNEKEKLYLLKGGQRIKLEIQNIEYYYERMLYFQKIINNAVGGYNSLLKHISNEIKAIGGTGTIHGCIVDIDFLNHIYVNPNDGKLSSYFALNMVDKYIYTSVGELLEKECPELYNNYIKLLKGSNEIKLLTGEKAELKELSNITYLKDTLMYSPSNQMKTIQYLTEMNVVRFWNDEIIDKFIAENEVKELTEEKEILKLK